MRRWRSSSKSFIVIVLVTRGAPRDSDRCYPGGPFRAGLLTRAKQQNCDNTRTTAGHLDGALGWMPAIWRPNVSRVLPDVDVEVGVTEDASSKGTKRKRAPPTKGPCEHGVKPRSRCKLCSACPHGKRRYHCKECGGAAFCEHGRERSKCKECGGASICEHGRERCRCKECGGSQMCEHGRERRYCKECGGSGICEHGRERSKCKECGGSQICEHGCQRSKCKECGRG